MSAVTITPTTTMFAELPEWEPELVLDAGIPRHKGDGRPKIFGEDQYELPENKRKGTFYTRASTFVDALDDKTGLYKWKMRGMLEGIARQPSIMEEYLALDDPMGAGKRFVDSLAEKAQNVADLSSKANVGTAMHAITEAIDTGTSPGFIPPEFVNDVRAYGRATAQLEWLAVEQFMVNDEWKAAGTPDRVALWEGRPVIADLKTGDLTYSYGKFAAQMALYAGASYYDAETFKRTPQSYRGMEVDRTVGLIIHLPAGEGVCEVVPVDLVKGAESLPLANEVRAWRSYWKAKKNRPAAVFTS